MTGKTRNLAAIFAQAAARHGSQRCAAVTYTRAAGLELKNRLAPVLGISPASVKTQLPYVGTIHSLCYQALGCPTLVDRKAFESFCHDVHMEAPQRSGWEDRVDDLEALPSLEVKEQEAEAFRMLLSSARHRMIPIEEMMLAWLDGLNDRELSTVELFDVTRIRWLAEHYQEWKRGNHLMDYEDLLDFGAGATLPIKFLICDEVQDNSPLMWSVVDWWGQHCEQVILAGDPYQSIYLFSGASPRLFMDHPGEKVLLQESHRLTNESVGFATTILERAGWADEGEVIGQWYGQAEPKGMDGSAFFLARTHRLLSPIRHQLMEEGEPFVELRGTAPWESIAGQAYRALTSLMAGNTQPRAYLAPIAKALKRRGKLPISARAADAIARERSMDPVWIDDARAAFGGADLSNLREMLEHYEYLHRVEVKHGIEGLWFPPSISIGTIHCSPPGEPILTANRGNVPIEELTEQDSLVSYDVRSGYMPLQGFKFSRTAFPYSGEILTFQTGTSTTRVTPNHMMRARLVPDIADKYVVYLMRKGPWWRIGQTKMGRGPTGQSVGLTRRVGNEMADAAWVLGCYPTRNEALYHEALYSTKYGIPDAGYIAWGWKRQLSNEQWADIFQESASAVGFRVGRLLADLGQDPLLPFFRRSARCAGENAHPRSSQRSFLAPAASLVPEMVLLPFHDDASSNRHHALQWEPCTVTREGYDGLVYDLEVLPHHYYFSGGLLVHNSAKGREADVVNLVKSWAHRPAASLEEDEGRRAEACVAYVSCTRHRVQLNLIEADEGVDYPWPEHRRWENASGPK